MTLSWGDRVGRVDLRKSACGEPNQCRDGTPVALEDALVLATDGVSVVVSPARG